MGKGRDRRKKNDRHAEGQRVKRDEVPAPTRSDEKSRKPDRYEEERRRETALD